MEALSPVTNQSLWIFGYGSLIWNPGFAYSTSRKAYAIGWVRRMYQGNTYHRGDEKLPGRVATLIEDSQSYTNGVVFRVDGKSAIANVVKYLEQREIDNGYTFRMVPVQIESSLHRRRPTVIMALTCVADQQNELYLGPDDPIKMGREIASAKGCSGPNCEYVLKLAEHVRKLFPNDRDDHLFQLERHVKIAKLML
uniref:glutathione-specific gamma-glutamylcyclotransferase n=1 Tax=Caenorhabditis japonica TaxID=281687 RepID=A0A8R1E2I7_CAEJA